MNLTKTSMKSMLSPKNQFLAVGAGSVLLSGGLIWGASFAAFSGTVDNSANSWEAAEIKLASDAQSALFAASNIKPGYNESRCITVSSNASVPVNVKVYSGDLVPSDLANSLDVSIVEGSGGTNSAGACTGFTPKDGVANVPVFNGKASAFASLNGYANAGGNATIAPGGSQQYRITVGLPSDASNNLQGTSTGFSFVWEGR